MISGTWSILWQNFIRIQNAFGIHELFHTFHQIDTRIALWIMQIVWFPKADSVFSTYGSVQIRNIFVDVWFNFFHYDGVVFFDCDVQMNITIACIQISKVKYCTMMNYKLNVKKSIPIWPYPMTRMASLPNLSLIIGTIS